ncbi:MAG: hypothetical protein N2651_05820 [Fimbriimonadales bacterium]|nr:hypothetical protein [Fimbriimonadales bacterium]
MIFAVGCVAVGVLFWLTQVAASPQSGDSAGDALRALGQGNYAEAARLAEQLKASDPEKASALRGAALAMQRQYAQAIPELQRAANATAGKPRYQTSYESLTALRIACLALSGERPQAVQLAKTFNRETAKLYAEQYPRPAIVYGILLGAAMPDAAFTPAEAQQMLRYDDPAYEVRHYKQHLQAYLQLRQRQYRPALTSLRRTYTDPEIAAVAPSAPQPETLLAEAYLHQQLGDKATMQARLRAAEQSLRTAMRQTNEEQRLMHYCTLALLGRVLFPKEWKL